MAPAPGPFTRADLETMPEDGRRYELVDGTLVVSPAPTWRHQRAVTRIALLLAQSCPRGWEVFVGPLDVVLAEDTVLEPDVLVARQEDLGERDLPAAPLLAVEVKSPSTARVDRWLKWSRYEAAGCPSYWIVDPQEPSLTSWDLVDGRYVEVAHVRGDEPYSARLPYPLTVVPAALVSD